MTDDRPVCDHCRSALPPNIPAGFCPTCDQMIRLAAVGMVMKIELWLELESQFVAWCLQHGQPNPHE